ncbi:T4SS-associated protein EirA [Coxiella burnetii]|uniref:T4SS-associated protein EirA n=1 Tax=Coxiella burnetii TaxID=777 RepID=UPI000593362F|nr:T4SS-associated protein EirA [Coxiella burnetii]ATN75315.1 hypothetical protein AYM90_10280 [Coxiella burnetii]ATN77223.1 hypothetical protein AYM94_10295 [Coxiella burnetii]ATN79066.1 hypothetical protein AYM93_09875 [Coxiella burnetii]ATN80975.1 hypothetical protein AYN00_09860 [Coxiella burnetii]OYK89243.1 hypothetical protein CbuQ195_10635 [Coxiella burnetii]
MRYPKFSLVFFVVLPLLATESAAAPATLVSPLPKGYLTCPEISKLQKDPNKMTWSAKNGWKSYSSSFASHLNKFLGAQWQGVNVGNITCLYQSDEKMTFPVSLEYNLLVYMPAGGKWSKNLGGYMNCVSHDQKQCIFKPQIQAKTGNLYQEVGRLKGTSQQEIGF